MIILEDISKHYRRGGEQVIALNNVNLKIARGELALLQGASGSGKTTLINLCAGLAAPTSGRVTICGRRLNDLPRRERTRLRASRVAVVFQLFHLTPYLTALENVLLTTLSKKVPDALDRAHTLLKDLGIAHRMHHRPGEMSAGERQRCALARALMIDPEVILADEPTGNLDGESAAVVLHTLDAWRSGGATILLASHQSIAKINPDRVYVLDAGELRQDR